VAIGADLGRNLTRRAARRVVWSLFGREKWRGTDGGFGGGWRGLRGPGVPFSRRRQVAVGGDARRRPVAPEREREQRVREREREREMSGSRASGARLRLPFLVFFLFLVAQLTRFS